MAEKILVVDDDIDSLKLIAMMLQRNGYDVVAANAGAQAIQRAKSDRPDLIILDVMMPDMSGYDVCRRLRSTPETKSIPIIMFTAKTLIDDKVAGFEAGADDYLTKPTHPAELASRVRAILARNAAQRPASQQRGATIGFLGAKGGVGTTTLAVNVAAARLKAGEHPLVADFRLGLGSLALSLGLGRAHGMANILLKSPDEITPTSVEAELLTHPSGLRVLASSARPKETQIPYNPDAIAALIRVIRTLARPGVFDLGCGLNATTMRIQRDIDHLVLVVDPQPVTLTMTREILAELEPNRPEHSSLHIVIVNRAATAAPSWNEIEQMLGCEIRAIISLASELMAQAQHSGMPAVLHQPTAIAPSQMIKLAEDILQRAKQSAAGPVTST